MTGNISISFRWKHRWLVLSNQSNIKYRSDPRIDPHFRCLMNTYDYEDALFHIKYNLKYNDTIETIWHYQKTIFELQQENEVLLAAYKDLSNQLYG